MEIGQRVRVKIDIYERERYAFRAAEALDKQTGTITIAKKDDDMYLVEFDNPVEGWNPYQSPVTSFWFPKFDLKEVNE